MAVLPRQLKRDFTSVCTEIKVFINPLRNAHVLTCTLRFRIELRLALGKNLGFSANLNYSNENN